MITVLYNPRLSLPGNIRRILPPDIGMDFFINQIFLLFQVSQDLASNRKFGETAQRNLVPDHLLFSSFSPQPCPVRLVKEMGRRNGLWGEISLYGSSLINRFSNGNWYPSDWDFKFRQCRTYHHIDTLIPFAEFLGHKSSDILVFGEVLDIDKYYPRHISVQIGAYIDVDATGENSVDLRESCILYQITQDYYNLDGWRPMSFPGHFFDPPEYHFRYIEPSTLERITGKGMILIENSNLLQNHLMIFWKYKSEDSRSIRKDLRRTTRFLLLIRKKFVLY